MYLLKKSMSEPTTNTNTPQAEVQFEFSIERILGFILLIPPLVSVLFFLYSVFDDKHKDSAVQLDNLNANWSGAGEGFTSAAPIYLGLLAIAGAILIRNSGKKSNKESGVV
jgi:hypothetical protein